VVASPEIHEKDAQFLLVVGEYGERGRDRLQTISWIGTPPGSRNWRRFWAAVPSP
jgi:hypothetical protein